MDRYFPIEGHIYICIYNIIYIHVYTFEISYLNMLVPGGVCIVKCSDIVNAIENSI